MSQDKNAAAQGASKPAQGPQVTLEQVANAATDNGKEPLKSVQKAWPKAGRVRAAGDRPMVHLLTNQKIPNDSDVKIDIDGYARAQLDAGKWVLATD